MKQKAKFPDSWGVIDATWDKGNLSIQVENHGKPETLLYSDVPRKVFNELKKAESKGGFFNKHIRNQFAFVGKV